MDLKVLYEDNHLIAVFKPTGMLTQGDITGDRCLMDEVKLYLKEKYKKPGNVFLGLLHRLDRPVSGIVLFAKTGKGASRLSEQFRNRTIDKTYHALVLGKPRENKGNLVNFIKKNANENAKRAELSYEVISSNSELSRSESEDRDEAKLHRAYSLLKINLKTGRFHQIRVQLTLLGHPIVRQDKNICLCATSISFKLATKNEMKEISIPIPKWSW